MGGNLIIRHDDSQLDINNMESTNLTYYSAFNIKKIHSKIMYKSQPITTKLKEGINFNLEEISTCLNSGILYNSSSREYYFNLIDLNRGKIIAKIRRKYKRIPYIERERKKFREANKKSKNTNYQFHADIRRIVPKEDCFWVITSCQKGMSWETDVYSLTGEYIDRFYLNIPGTIIGAQDGFIWIRIFYPDETTIIRKCRPE